MPFTRRLPQKKNGKKNRQNSPFIESISFIYFLDSNYKFMPFHVIQCFAHTHTFISSYLSSLSEHIKKSSEKQIVLKSKYLTTRIIK